MPEDGLLFFALTTALVLLFSILLSIFLFLVPGKKFASSRLLGLLIATIGLKSLNILANGLLLDNPFLLYNYALGFFLAPLLLLYARSLLGAAFLPHKDWFHFIPFGIVGLTGLIPGQIGLLMNSYWELAPLLYTAVYLGSALAFLRQRVPYLKEIRSNIPAGKARALLLAFSLWGVKIILAGFGVLLRAGSNEAAIQGSGLAEAVMAMDVLILASFAILAFTREEPVRPIRFEEEALARMIAAREPADAAAIRKNADLFKKLDVILQQEKLYLDPGLTLPQFSRLANSTPEKVSLAINSVGGQSFFDYINGYRVFTAQELLADKDKKLSLREVMYAAGFHSRHTFEAAFRKVAGMTPDQFTKKNR